METYRTAARAAAPMDYMDVKKFTEGVLSFWRMQGTKMPEWRKAAKIVFTIPPTSAASERVFSLLEAKYVRRGTRCGTLGSHPGFTHAALQ